MKGKKMTEENKIDFAQEESETREEEAPELETSEEESSEVVEVEWEDMEELLMVRQNYSDNQALLSDMLVTHERQKLNLLQRMNDLEAAMNKIARDLQEKCALNLDWTYELKLPTQLGEKGYFIRKED
tara:strand:+ start:3040 stop:3423 length:384 start_codon:yes stop_codon:yes gene_type:complete